MIGITPTSQAQHGMARISTLGHPGHRTDRRTPGVSFFLLSSFEDVERLLGAVTRDTNVDSVGIEDRLSMIARKRRED